MAVEVAAAPFAARSRYLKLRDRESYEFALVSVAAALELDDGLVRSARIALGGVAHKPWRAQEAERVLVGRPLDDLAAVEAGAAAVRGAQPRRDNAFKVALVERVVIRALAEIGGLA